MRGDVKVKADGKEHTLRLTLGAMEDFAEADFAPAAALIALETGVWNWRELSVALNAGLKGAGETITARDLEEKIGATECHRVAVKLLRAFFRMDDPSGNADAAGKGKGKPSAS